MSGETSTSGAPLAAARPRNNPAAFAGGAVIGALGGLIGLGGAEFRLPLLIGAFRFAALQAVILNKALSLVVVASALPFRAAAVPFAGVAAHWPIIVNLLAGSLIGAWFGASWATRLASQSLYRVIAVLLLGIAVVLVIGHDMAASSAMLTGTSCAGGRQFGTAAGRSNGDFPAPSSGSGWCGRLPHDTGKLWDHSGRGCRTVRRQQRRRIHLGMRQGFAAAGGR